MMAFVSVEISLPLLVNMLKWPANERTKAMYSVVKDPIPSDAEFVSATIDRHGVARILLEVNGPVSGEQLPSPTVEMSIVDKFESHDCEPIKPRTTGAILKTATAEEVRHAVEEIVFAMEREFTIDDVTRILCNTRLKVCPRDHVAEHLQRLEDSNLIYVVNGTGSPIEQRTFRVMPF